VKFRRYFKAGYCFYKSGKQEDDVISWELKDTASVNFSLSIVNRRNGLEIRDINDKKNPDKPAAKNDISDTSFLCQPVISLIKAQVCVTVVILMSFQTICSIYYGSSHC
jgi:hypothetical protein